jgi:hypothetical protein
MAKDGDTFECWLDRARIPQSRLSPERLAVLRAVFAFLDFCGRDYVSMRIIGHFLVHCGIGLKVSQVARLVGVSRNSASRQSNLSSREVVREIQHRLSGRPYGKLLPRYAGPIAEFVLTHADATRMDVLDFIERTWRVKVSIVALHKFMKKFGLDRASRLAVTTETDPANKEQALIEIVGEPPVPARSLPIPSEDFFSDTLASPALSCCCPK